MSKPSQLISAGVFSNTNARAFGLPPIVGPLNLDRAKVDFLEESGNSTLVCFCRPTKLVLRKEPFDSSASFEIAAMTGTSIGSPQTKTRF
ncbi:hypothetical protein CO678_16045 [Bradyrhizobium diazoefficiens]|nr:hypothetical protein CO678_16045 [Bradyrhizobium diazoefficiens]